MRKTTLLAALGLLIASLPLHGREYTKPPAMVNPLRSVGIDSSTWVPAGYFAFGHWRFDFKGSDFDLFEVRTSGAATVFQHNARFGVGLFVSSILTSGPGPEGWDPPTRVEWRMDAMQYEYGINLGYRFGELDLLLEYSRYSFHPFRDAAADPYYENSADHLRVGVMPPPLRFGAVETEGYLRSGWLDIYDMWDSPFDRPRAFWKTTIGAWADVPLREEARRLRQAGSAAEGARAFVYLEPELLFLREGGADLDFYAEAGVRLPGDFANLDLFLHYTRIGDIEEVEDRQVTVNLVGLGLRLAAEPRRQETR